MWKDSWSNTVVKFVNSCKSAWSYLRTGAVNNRHTLPAEEESCQLLFSWVSGVSQESFEVLSKAWVLGELHAEIQREPAGCAWLQRCWVSLESAHTTWAVHGAVTSVTSHLSVLFGFNNLLVMKTTERTCQGAGFYVGHEPLPSQEALVLKPGACSQNTCWCADRNTWVTSGTGLQVPVGVVAASSSRC